MAENSEFIGEKMITLTREEAQQVLDALQAVWKMDRSMKHSEAIETLRARLAQPEPEPVAWMEKENYLDEDNLWETRTVLRDYDNGSGVPLYTAPPQHKK